MTSSHTNRLQAEFAVRRKLEQQNEVRTTQEGHKLAAKRPREIIQNLRPQ